MQATSPQIASLRGEHALLGPVVSKDALKRRKPKKEHYIKRQFRLCRCLVRSSPQHDNLAKKKLSHRDPGGIFALLNINLHLSGSSVSLPQSENP